MILTIPNTTEGENFEFVEAVKYEVKVEVFKITVTQFEQAAQISLQVDSAIWNAARSGGVKPRRNDERIHETGARIFVVSRREFNLNVKLLSCSV